MELQIEREVNKAIDILGKVIELNNKSLLTKIDKNAITTYFQFPDEIKTSCNQYLIYFTQFMADIGIDIDTEIKEEANQTLFRILPRDKKEGLEKIKEALYLYLNTPNDKNFEARVVDYNDVSVKQWEANVYHLKSQLAIAASILQAKETTIEALQLSNYQYKQLVESHEKKANAKKGEDIIKDIVSVKHYDGKWFDVNFPEILRRLKRKLNG